MNIFVAYPGCVSSPSTFGGSPYFLVDGFRAAGFAIGSIDSESPVQFPMERFFWNAFEFINGRGVGGFQYSRLFLSKYSGCMPNGVDDVVINMFQMYDPEYFDSTKSRRVFYIDQTLSQLFEGYGETFHLSVEHRSQAVDEEARQYRTCEAIFCKQSWVAHDLINRYKVDASKVKVVIPGANVDNRAYLEWRNKQVPESLTKNSKEPLRLIFIGKDWKRKGLDRLVDAALLIPCASERIKIDVIGVDRAALPGTIRNCAFVDIIGFINKELQIQEFMNLVKRADLGVLLSRAEAGGSSLREFQLFGLGVLGPRVGGSPDMICAGAGVLIAPEDSPKQIAAVLERLIECRSEVENMKAAARVNHDCLLWSETATQMMAQIRRLTPRQDIC